MKKKTWIVGFLGAVMIILALSINVQAASQKPFEPTQKSGGHLPFTYQQCQILGSFWPKGGDYMTPLYNKNFTMKAVSTNKKVATVKIETIKINGCYRKLLYVSAKGAGSTNIQVTVKVNGKTYKRTFPYRIYKYENPFSSFKINGQNYTSKLNKLKSGRKVAIGSVKYVNWIPPKGTLTYKLKKNYKIKYIDALDKNGMTIPGEIGNKCRLPEECRGFWIGYENTKTKAYGELYIGK